MKEKMTPHIIAVMALVLFIAGESAAVFGQTPADENQPTGTIVEGSSLVEKFSWLNKNAEKDQTYVVVVDKDESIPPQALSGKAKTIILWGNGKPQTISLNKKGQLFTINGGGVKLVLDRNIVLQGKKDSTKPLVEITNGTVEMNEGAVITSNNRGAVYINRNGKFIMNGGTITENACDQLSGVVQVAGIFEMTGGSIYNNDGRGVCLYSNASTIGTFNMSGGSINGNKGDGVFMYAQSKFTMNGGTIFDNAGYGVLLNQVNKTSLLGPPKEWNFFYLNDPATRASIHDNKRGQVFASLQSIFTENGVGQNGSGAKAGSQYTY